MANFDELVASANKGNRKSQLKLGELFLSKGNFAKAAEWLEKAAERNEPAAQYHLAFLYANGAGVAKDLVKATDYLKASAENEHISAQAQLGSFYIQGNGVPRDEQMGLFWTRKAAAAGSELAIGNLGIAYLRGLGMSKNLDKAREYLLRAVSLGFAPAKEILLAEAEALRDENDEDDKDYMQKLVAEAEAEFQKNKPQSPTKQAAKNASSAEKNSATAVPKSQAIEEKQESNEQTTQATNSLQPNPTSDNDTNAKEEFAEIEFEIEEDNEDLLTDEEDSSKEKAAYLIKQDSSIKQSKQDESDEDEQDDENQDDQDDDRQDEQQDDDENKDSDEDDDELQEGFFSKLKKFLHKMFVE